MRSSGDLRESRTWKVCVWTVLVLCILSSGASIMGEHWGFLFLSVLGVSATVLVLVQFRRRQ